MQGNLPGGFIVPHHQSQYLAEDPTQPISNHLVVIPAASQRLEFRAAIKVPRPTGFPATPLKERPRMEVPQLEVLAIAVLTRVVPQEPLKTA